MEQSIDEINEFVIQFTENYTKNVVEDDVVSFYNDLYIMLQHFNSLKNDSNKLNESYEKFMNHALGFKNFLKEYSSFDFDSIKTLDLLQNNANFKELNPIYTPYSFTETEETIDQIFEEIKAVKEFHKELKEEINYLLDEYRFHLDHLKENMLYNFYSYEELDEAKDTDLDEKIEELKTEKSKFLQKCNDKLAKK